MTGQAALPLSWPDRFGLDSFIVADCNRMAFDLICHPENWAGHVLLLQGPDFSGKTHLAHIFTKLHKAKMFVFASGMEQEIEQHIVIDSVDKILTQHPEKTEALFHLVNEAILGQKRILLTMRETPNQWATLPDLLSRLQASQQVSLSQPDEKMIKEAYKKLFIDRGLIVDNKVLDYLTLRGQRSFAEIRENVFKLDKLALEKGCKITIPLIQNAGLLTE
jgi:chromosomal replication initiation ATPase DnaA